MHRKIVHSDRNLSPSESCYPQTATHQHNIKFDRSESNLSPHHWAYHDNNHISSDCDLYTQSYDNDSIKNKDHRPTYNKDRSSTLEDDFKTMRQPVRYSNYNSEEDRHSYVSRNKTCRYIPSDDSFHSNEDPVNRNDLPYKPTYHSNIMETHTLQTKRSYSNSLSRQQHNKDSLSPIRQQYLKPQYSYHHTSNLKSYDDSPSETSSYNNRVNSQQEIYTDNSHSSYPYIHSKRYRSHSKQLFYRKQDDTNRSPYRQTSQSVKNQHNCRPNHSFSYKKDSTSTLLRESHLKHCQSHLNNPHSVTPTDTKCFLDCPLDDIPLETTAYKPHQKSALSYSRHAPFKNKRIHSESYPIARHSVPKRQDVFINDHEFNNVFNNDDINRCELRKRRFFSSSFPESSPIESSISTVSHDIGLTEIHKKETEDNTINITHATTVECPNVIIHDIIPEITPCNTLIHVPLNNNEFKDSLIEPKKKCRWDDNTTRPSSTYELLPNQTTTTLLPTATTICEQTVVSFNDSMDIDDIEPTAPPYCSEINHLKLNLDDSAIVSIDRHLPDLNETLSHDLRMTEPSIISKKEEEKKIENLKLTPAVICHEDFINTHNPNNSIINDTIETPPLSCINTTCHLDDTDTTVESIITYTLPLDTHLLRQELFYRLQLSLWGANSRVSSLENDLNLEKRRHQILYSIVSEVIYVFLLFKNQLSLTNNTSSQLINDVLQLSLTPDLSCLLKNPAQKTLLKNIDYCVNESLWQTINEWISLQLNTSSSVTDIEQQIKHSLGPFVEKCIELPERITPNAHFPLPLQRTDILKESLFDHLNLAEMNGTTLTQTLMAYIRHVLIDYTQLKSQFNDMTIQKMKWEQNAEQYRKQISMYLSRDPDAHLFLGIAESDESSILKDTNLTSPEFVLSRVSQLIRINRHLQEQIKEKDLKLQEASKMVSELHSHYLRIDVLEDKDACINSNDSSHQTSHISTNVLQQCHTEYLSILQKSNQLIEENQKLLSEITNIKIKHLTSEEETDKVLFKRCITAEDINHTLTNDNKQLVVELTNLKIENETSNSRMRCIQEDYDILTQTTAKSTERLCILLQQATANRETLNNTAAESDAIRSLMFQRERLTVEVDELSAALEEKIFEITVLQKRCKERSEHCITLVEEGLQRQQQEKLLQQQIEAHNERDTVVQQELLEIRKDCNLYREHLNAARIEKLNLLNELAEQSNKFKLAAEDANRCKEKIGALEIELQEKQKKITILERTMDRLNSNLLRIIDEKATTELFKTSPAPLVVPQVSQFLQSPSSTTPQSATPCKSASASSATLQLEIDALRLKFLCSLCNEHWKNSFIKKCGHPFCHDCLKNTLQSRNRKCPQCIWTWYTVTSYFKKNRITNLTHSYTSSALMLNDNMSVNEIPPCDDPSCHDSQPPGFLAWLRNRRQRITLLPPNRIEIGRAGWLLLHSAAANFSNEPTIEEQRRMNRWIYSFANLYPCHICRLGFIKVLETVPPDTRNFESFTMWSCEAHNAVNAEIGSTQYPCDLSKLLAQFQLKYP